jgi:hypothetical protein
MNTLNDLTVAAIVKMGKCVPSNDMLAGPLKEPFEQLIGAFYGLMPYIITAIAVVIAVASIVAIKSERAADGLKLIAWILLIPVALWFLLMLYFIVTGSLFQPEACPF